jgi:hypothetical protein
LSPSRAQPPIVRRQPRRARPQWSSGQRNPAAAQPPAVVPPAWRHAPPRPEPLAPELPVSAPEG